MVQAVAEALRGGRRYDVEYRVVRPNGTVRLVQSQGDVMRDESGRPRRMFGTVQDITERKRAEQRLRTQHTVTQMLAEAATLEEAIPKILQAVCEFLLWDLGALWRLDREAGVLRCVEVWHKESIEVPNFEAISRESTFMPGTGFRAESGPAVNPCTFLMSFTMLIFRARPSPRAKDCTRPSVSRFCSAEMSWESWSSSAARSRQPEQDLLNMMATLGSQIGQFIERKRAEDALHHAQTELAHVTRVATLGEMTASIAHEINQPLTAVVTNGTAGLRWLAAPTPNLDEARSALERIIRDGKRAGDVIARIRALVKKSTLTKAQLNLSEMIQEVLAITNPEARQHRIWARTELAPGLPPVQGDRVQLQQVILNLVMNGIEAMKTVTDRPRELLIRSRPAWTRQSARRRKRLRHRS